MKTLAILLLCCATTVAQQPAAAPKPAKKKKPAVPALAKGKTRVFKAIVMKVTGTAQARTDGRIASPDERRHYSSITQRLCSRMNCIT